MSDQPGLTMTVAGDAASPDTSLPVLNEGAAPLDLPERATLLPDGTVRLDLEFPCEVKYREVGGQVARSDSYDHLVLRRLQGPDMRRILDAKNTTNAALARSAGLTPAKLALLLEKMDSSDVGAAQQVINELLGGQKEGLPAHAEETDAGIRLPLLYPATDGDGEAHSELMFGRMTGADRAAIAQAKNPLDWAIHRATGLTPKAAHGLVDDMDGADIVAAQQVIAFLSGSGRRTGR
jgi:hypothetical protein